MQSLNGYILVEPQSETESVSSGGLVFQVDTSKSYLRTGKVLCESNEGPVGIKEGSTVFYPQDKAFNVQDGGDTIVAVKAEHVVAVKD